MFDFKSANAPRKLNRDFILSKVSDAQIFYYYFGPFNLKDVYPSKFGAGKHRDRNHSTGFYVSASGKLIYNHLNGREDKMDCFSFVQRLYNCTFSDALKRIAGDFGLVGNIDSEVMNKTRIALASFDRTYKTETKIHFVPMPFTPEAGHFWKPYGITKEELKREGVYQIKKLYINETLIPNSDNALRFALTVPHKDELLVKVYSPGSDSKLKWVSNIPLDMPFGLNNLKKPGKFSFIAKAVKDMIVLKKFLPSVIASQNENYSSIPDKVIKKLEFNFEKNYIGWDNDWPGLRGMVPMRKKGFIPLYVPVEYRIREGIKDFSDLAKERGLNAVEDLLKQNNLI